MLRQAWQEHIKPVLVLNKIDRLILKLKMTAMEAHLHLLQLIQQVVLTVVVICSSSCFTEFECGTYHLLYDQEAENSHQFERQSRMKTS